MITENGCSILKINNDVSIVSSPIAEALEQSSFYCCVKEIGNDHDLIDAPQTDIAQVL
ncbi:hypothetical protein CPS_0226 [Colwellia psychrerythraea 34H]|uniref:Uncharacterized protein n=1 Tax=Colwellia psychrerythraea (strain 34H / ATCC BAA-681) TaxID=167879 RepID=Q48AC0_COLP3|nr:hypothetical protein CPS_0226 [Colwellia psychrerythraea 34H]